ncbi:MAG: PEP-CTERM sorting domain-containing protein [Akkermansiaceae bacterium]
MKKSLHTISSLTALTLGLTSVSANAVLVLTYDSNTTGVTTAADTIQLEAIDNATTSPNSAFVTGESSTTFTSTGTVARNSNNQQIVSDRPETGTATAGIGDDISFNFGGSGNAYDATTNALTVANINSNPYLGMSFTSVQDMTLDSLSFNLSVNSGGGGYAARDVGLFVSLDSGVFTQFGDLVNNTGTGNQGIQTFTQAGYNIASGQTVELRLLFTDKTNSSAANDNIQGGTRVGNIEIFASPVPEPSSVALLGLGGLALIMRRRK